MPFSLFQNLGLDVPTPTTMSILIVDHSIKKLMGVLCGIFMKVDRFIFLAKFIILDCEIDRRVSIILKRLFLATKWALVDIECNEIKFWVNIVDVSINVSKSMKKPKDF